MELYHCLSADVRLSMAIGRNDEGSLVLLIREGERTWRRLGRFDSEECAERFAKALWGMTSGHEQRAVPGGMRSPVCAEDGEGTADGVL